MKTDLRAIYHKYRIYGTEVYRILKKRYTPRTNDEIKKEYEKPLATIDPEWCSVTPNGLRMITEDEYRVYLKSFFHDYFDVLNFDSMLEVGCGAGKNLMWLSSLYPLVSLYGLDFSQQCIMEAKENCPGAKLFCCSAKNIPLEDNSIDYVITVHALEQMSNVLPEVVSELYRVCRKGVILFEPFYEVQNFFGRIHFSRLFFPKNIPFVVEKNGFNIVYLKDIQFGNPATRTGLLFAEKVKDGVE